MLCSCVCTATKQKITYVFKLLPSVVIKHRAKTSNTLSFSLISFPNSEKSSFNLEFFSNIFVKQVDAEKIPTSNKKISFVVFSPESHFENDHFVISQK